MTELSVRVKGTGTYLPGNPVPYDDITRFLGELKDAPQSIQKWYSRTHKIMKDIINISYCHYAIDPDSRKIKEDNVDMAVKASLNALQKADLKPEEIDIIIFGGNYSHQMPPMSSRLQEALGIDFCSELHINSNCTSVYKALLIAHDFLRLGRYKNALVVSSNISSSFLRSEYYNQQKIQKKDLFLRFYLCDGASAVVLQSSDTLQNGFFIESTYMESPGCHKEATMGSSLPAYYENPLEVYNNCSHHISQLFQKELKENFVENGHTIFFNGLKRMIKKDSINLTNIKSFLINMPTKYVVDSIVQECETIGIPKSCVFTTIDNMGYAGPPAAFISLDKLIQNQTFKDQDLILSFVTEVSKFMQAGFTIRYFE
ncbi:MAG: 3-oxoacyl-ACP synthase III family protein [Proteobacteria bacterium]|nr:3-oxoacyl-ACP synthase III family protein [Pseudomonadota bacterium]